jgi:nucleotide-binding universal stress UspA family protein
MPGNAEVCESRKCPEEGVHVTVVAGVDGSPVSELVVTRAIEQARWRETDLHLVFVSYMPLIYTETVIDWDQVLEAQRESVWKKLTDIIRDAEVEVRQVDLDGYPPDALVGYANDAEAALLVVGTRGRGELASLILGSTSHRAVHLARCDVLIVKAPETEDWSSDDVSG